jgi:hypothetical protein
MFLILVLYGVHGVALQRRGDGAPAADEPGDAERSAPAPAG